MLTQSFKQMIANEIFFFIVSVVVCFCFSFLKGFDFPEIFERFHQIFDHTHQISKVFDDFQWNIDPNYGNDNFYLICIQREIFRNWIMNILSNLVWMKKIFFLWFILNRKLSYHNCKMRFGNWNDNFGSRPVNIVVAFSKMWEKQWIFTIQHATIYFI